MRTDWLLTDGGVLDGGSDWFRGIGPDSEMEELTKPCEQGNWDTWTVLDPWNQV